MPKLAGFALVLIFLIVLFGEGSKRIQDDKPKAIPSKIRPQSPPRQHQRRRPGPRFWVKQTEDWGSGDAVSKRRDFPGYNDPTSRQGVIRDRKIKSDATVGTVFAVAPNRIWLTARHVVDNCREAVVHGGLNDAGKPYLKVVRITLHPRADVAIVTTVPSQNQRTAFELAADPVSATEAFHIGFPAGKPGAVHSRFLGRQSMHRRGPRGYTEEVLVWAEITRIPGRSGSLGGLSGGAVIDSTGAVIGSNSAENRRRGRIMTSSPKSLRQVAALAGFTTQTAAPGRFRNPNLNARDYPSVAKSLIQSRQVARLLCKVKK